MRIKFTLSERETIGIGVYQTTYETNIKLDNYPACGRLLERIEEMVLSQLGSSIEEAGRDSAYSMGLVVTRKRDLGMLLPGDNYSLVITESGCVKRLERGFQLQGDDL